MSFSKIIVMGNLTKDPNLNYTPKGNAVCTLNIAENARERDPKTGEQTDRVTFFKATAWGKQAEAIATYFERGSEIYIEGKFKPEMWTDKDGKDCVTFGIQVTDFNFTGGTNRNNGRAASATAASASSSAATQNKSSNTSCVDDDIDLGGDIPF